MMVWFQFLTITKMKDMIVVVTGDNISFKMEIKWENKISKENNKLQKWFDLSHMQKFKNSSVDVYSISTLMKRK